MKISFHVIYKATFNNRIPLSLNDNVLDKRVSHFPRNTTPLHPTPLFSTIYNTNFFKRSQYYLSPPGSRTQ